MFPHSIFGVSTITITTAVCQEFCRRADLRHVVLESDAPYLGRRAFDILPLVNHLAVLRNASQRTILGATAHTAAHFFHKLPPFYVGPWRCKSPSSPEELQNSLFFFVCLLVFFFNLNSFGDLCLQLSSGVAGLPFTFKIFIKTYIESPCPFALGKVA